MAKFEIGDIIKKKWGSVSHIVEDNRSGYITVRNTNTNRRQCYEYASEYELVTSAEAAKKEINMNKLFEFVLDGITVYGTKLATNSNNMAVMEVKGTDVPVVVDPKSLTEVVPYTVSVKAVKSGTTQIVNATKDKVSKGDLLIDSSGAFWVVTGLDTKKYASSAGLKITRKVSTTAFAL